MKGVLVKHRPSPALVVAIIALCVALAGTAYAATKIGTKNIRNGAVTTKKLKNRAVTAGKLANGAVTAEKIGPNAVTSGAIAADAVTSAKIANGAVGASQLAPGVLAGGSAGFVATANGQQAIAASLDPTPLAQLSLPAASAYVVTAQMTLGNAGNTPGNFINCFLTRNNAPLSQGVHRMVAGAVFEDTITLTGAIDQGGTLRLSCSADNSAQAKNVVLTATQVTSLTGS